MSRWAEKGTEAAATYADVAVIDVPVSHISDKGFGMLTQARGMGKPAETVQGCFVIQCFGLVATQAFTVQGGARRRFDGGFFSQGGMAGKNVHHVQSKTALFRRGQDQRFAALFAMTRWRHSAGRHGVPPAVVLEKGPPFFKADFAVFVGINGVEGGTLHVGMAFLEILESYMAFVVRVHAPEAFISPAVVSGLRSRRVRRLCPKGQGDAEGEREAKKQFHGVS
jgi:hypothetical protein